MYVSDVYLIDFPDQHRYFFSLIINFFFWGFTFCELVLIANIVL